MSTAARIAGLTFIPAGVVGLTQFHYVVSHLSQIATGATAIGLGVAVWGGHSVIGKVKLRNEERKAAKAQPPAVAPTAEQAQAYLQGVREALTQGQPVRDWSESKRVIDLGRIER